jgi:phosphate transport system protein
MPRAPLKIADFHGLAVSEGSTLMGREQSFAWGAERPCVNRQFVREMETLWVELMRLAAIVESSLRSSVQALCMGRDSLIDEVNRDERLIDRWQVRIERDCLRILALHQPVASDLRRVTVAMKISSDFERMGDLADHIARRARKLMRRSTPVPISPQMEFLAMESLAQVRDALDSLARGDTDLARAVIRSDKQVDLRRRLILKDLKRSIRRDPSQLTLWLHLINTARNFERVADHATNVAESVIYLEEGEFVSRLDEPRIAESA